MSCSRTRSRAARQRFSASGTMRISGIPRELMPRVVPLSLRDLHPYLTPLGRASRLPRAAERPACSCARSARTRKPPHSPTWPPHRRTGIMLRGCRAGPIDVWGSWRAPAQPAPSTRWDHVVRPHSPPHQRAGITVRVHAMELLGSNRTVYETRDIKLVWRFGFMAP